MAKRMSCMNFTWDLESFERVSALLHEVNLYVQLIQGQGVPMIAIQSVCLFDEKNPARPIALEVRDHLGELFTTRSLGRFNVDELAYDFESIVRRNARSSFTWASMEKPSSRCSRLDTRA